jgi:hypothetical protein
VLTLAVSVVILATRWDPITASHPAYFITLRLVAVVSLAVGAWSLLTLRRTSAERVEPQPEAVEGGPSDGEPVESESRTRPRWRVVVGRSVSVVAVLGLVAVLLYLRPLPASSTAVDAMAGTPGATVSDSSSRITLRPTAAASTTGLVFYPGALVDPRAYVPNLLPLAEAGHPVVIIKVPYNIAFFDPNGAGAVMDSNPEVERWVVGGHSLGGVMASSVAGRDDDRVRGLLLWASFPNGSIADRTELVAMSIYGSEDELTTPADIEDSRDRLPPDATFVEVVGGNHAFFGDYGTQSGDGEASITREDAQRQIRAASLDLMGEVAALAPAGG